MMRSGERNHKMGTGINCKARLVKGRAKGHNMTHERGEISREQQGSETEKKQKEK